MKAVAFRMEVQAALDDSDIRINDEAITAAQVWEFARRVGRIRREALQFCQCEHPAEMRCGRMCTLCERNVGTIQEAPAA